MDNAAELLEYAELDGTEWGEAMESLCAVKRHEGAYGSRFVFLVDAEIATQLKYAKTHSTIVTNVKTVSYPVKTLEWNT